MLMSDGIQKQIFDELKEIQKLNSSYKYEDVSPITHVQELAMTMQVSLGDPLKNGYFNVDKRKQNQKKKQKKTTTSNFVILLFKIDIRSTY